MLSTVQEGLKHAIGIALEMEKEDSKFSNIEVHAYASERMKLLISKLEKIIKVGEDHRLKYFGEGYYGIGC